MRYLSILVILLCPASLLHAQQSIRFVPNSYSNVFSSKPAPVLSIQPGDTIHTTSVDAGGWDQHGVRVAKRGNPLTGPFFIQSAQPGDVLAVTLLHVGLNRNFATTLNSLVPKVLPKALGRKTWRYAKLIKWQLDLENLTGSPIDTTGQVPPISIPLHPFLGCVGVALEGDKEYGTGASGAFGGNLDFSFNTTGATVYLPVYHPGALLFLGDGHAAQGDGELNGDALETSMNFSFTVKVLKKSDFPLQTPMVENADYLMFFGIEPTLDKSMLVATEAMRAWLQGRYQLSLTAVSQIIGPAVEYRIPKVAASKVEVVAMIPRKLLDQLDRYAQSRTSGTTGKQ